MEEIMVGNVKIITSSIKSDQSYRTVHIKFIGVYVQSEEFINNVSLTTKELLNGGHSLSYIAQYIFTTIINLPIIVIPYPDCDGKDFIIIKVI